MSRSRIVLLVWILLPLTIADGSSYGEALDFRSGAFHQGFRWVDEDSEVQWRGLFQHRHSRSEQIGRLLLVGKRGDRVVASVVLRPGDGERTTSLRLIESGYEATCVDDYGRTFDSLGEMLRYEPKQSARASRRFFDSLDHSYGQEIPAVDLVLVPEESADFEQRASHSIEVDPDGSQAWRESALEILRLYEALEPLENAALGSLFACPAMIAARADLEYEQSVLRAEASRPLKGVDPESEVGRAVLEAFRDAELALDGDLSAPLE